MLSNCESWDWKTLQIKKSGNMLKKMNSSLVTFDTDFYDLSLLLGNPPKIVWIRTFNQTTKNIELILRKHINDLIEFQKEKKSFVLGNKI
jgi:predicted nuclease of predicted toxin-antitoxin system